MRFASAALAFALLARLAAAAAADVTSPTPSPLEGPRAQRHPTIPAPLAEDPSDESPPVPAAAAETSPPSSPEASLTASARSSRSSRSSRPARDLRAKRKRLVARAAASAEAAEPLPERGVTLGISFPPRMFAGDGGFSLTYGFARHYAVRANFASFTELGPLDFDREASYDGRSTDLGAGFVWYPRRLWSGPTVEVGAFARERTVEVEVDDDSKLTDTDLIASRFLLGWSWRYREVFLAVAAGVSLGYERGTETIDRGYDDMPPVEKRLSRVGTATETYFRAGFVFGK